MDWFDMKKWSPHLHLQEIITASPFNLLSGQSAGGRTLKTLVSLSFPPCVLCTSSINLSFKHKVRPGQNWSSLNRSLSTLPRMGKLHQSHRAYLFDCGLQTLQCDLWWHSARVCFDALTIWAVFETESKSTFSTYWNKCYLDTSSGHVLLSM